MAKYNWKKHKKTRLHFENSSPSVMIPPTWGDDRLHINSTGIYIVTVQNFHVNHNDLWNLVSGDSEIIVQYGPGQISWTGILQEGTELYVRTPYAYMPVDIVINYYGERPQQAVEVLGGYVPVSFPNYSEWVSDHHTLRSRHAEI